MKTYLVMEVAWTSPDVSKTTETWCHQTSVIELGDNYIYYIGDVLRNGNIQYTMKKLKNDGGFLKWVAKALKLVKI